MTVNVRDVRDQITRDARTWLNHVTGSQGFDPAYVPVQVSKDQLAKAKALPLPAGNPDVPVDVYPDQGSFSDAAHRPTPDGGYWLGIAGAYDSNTGRIAVTPNLATSLGLAKEGVISTPTVQAMMVWDHEHQHAAGVTAANNGANFEQVAQTRAYQSLTATAYRLGMTDPIQWAAVRQEADRDHLDKYQ